MSAITIDVPDDLLAQAKRKAEAQGRTTDELAVEALRRYLAVEWIKELTAGAEERRRQYGLKTDQEVEDYVDRVVHEYRREQRSR